MIVRLPFVVFVALASACASTRPPSSATTLPLAPSTARLVLTHVTVIDVAKGIPQPDQTVVIEGDKIVSVGPHEEVPASPETMVVDAGGKYLIPGLWDMHVHFLDTDSARLFVANGVTGVRVMWGNPRFGPGTERVHDDLRDSYEGRKAIGPRMMIASQLLDGPNPIWSSSVSLSNPEEGRKAVQEAKKSGADFIKVYSLLPRDVYLAIVDESQKQGIPFEGHVPEAVSVIEASDLKQKSIEHLNGMMVACSSLETELRKEQAEFAKSPRPPADWSKFKREQAVRALSSYDDKHAEALFATLAKNSTYQCPTMTVNNAIATMDSPTHSTDPRLVYVSPYFKQRWDPKADFRFKSWTAKDFEFKRSSFQKELAIVGAMNKAGVPLLAGTDEGNPFCFAGFSLHDELGWFVKAGLSPAEALRTATLNPASFFGQETTMGTVAQGNVADLVLVDADPLADIANTKKISAVISRGVLYQRAALDKMLEEVKFAVEHPQ